MPTSEFRFSPRPNRAHEIDWQPWGPHAFARAQAEHKPILLAISAVWCHWCHVMDETTYSDPDVIAAIGRQYVAIRIDNDRRPDINARYNMGGWPTTAFLASDGTLLTGATYLPAPQMRRALSEVATFYRENAATVAQRSTLLEASEPQPAHADGLTDAPIAALIAGLERSFDPEYGGFGDAPKFPQPEVLELLLFEWRRTRDANLYRMLAETLLGMARGGTYDHVEGGFFRYSTTRDWSVPHFEKMAEDHGGLLRVLAQLVAFGGAPELRPVLVSALGYVRTTLRDPNTGLFAGSQDADEAYFALPLEARRAREAPFVDRTSYTNWSCALAGAWCWAGFALDDDALLREGAQTLETVHERLLDDDGLAYHVAIPGEPPDVRGLLTDQAAYLRALLDAHEITGEARFLERAAELAHRIAERFEAEGGGFYDRLPIDPLGRLEIVDRPIVDNALTAESLLRLAAISGERHLHDAAERALGVFSVGHAAAGSFAAAYARALRRALEPETAVKIVGQPVATRELRRAALRLPGPSTVVATVHGPQAEAAGVPPEPVGVAYLCSGRVCSAPATGPAELRAHAERAGNGRRNTP